MLFHKYAAAWRHIIIVTFSVNVNSALATNLSVLQPLLFLTIPVLFHFQEVHSHPKSEDERETVEAAYVHGSECHSWQRILWRYNGLICGSAALHASPQKSLAHHAQLLATARE